MSSACSVRLRFCPPPAELGRYFTSFYLAEIDVPDGGIVDDLLHPEWGNLRFLSGALPIAENQAGVAVSGTDFVVTGPSATALRFRVGTTRLWGVGLLPLGWSRLVPGPAAAFADVVADGHAHPAFAHLRGLADTIFGPEPDADGELARISSFFQRLLRAPGRREEAIVAAHEALIDPAITSVAEMAARCGLSGRSLERICTRSFGFPPKLLLRRQRFIRSLAQFMLAPTPNWIDAIDAQYHDQAQFIRDFHRFMGMSPGRYAARPHPVLDVIVRERARLTGTPMQALDAPGGKADRGLPLLTRDG
jgi:AraC-like DNA-binding protein